MTGEEARELRETLGLNQTEFWGAIGLTQSAGSRYESGRTLPKPVRMLLNLAYAEKTAAETLFATLRRQIGDTPSRPKHRRK